MNYPRFCRNGIEEALVDFIMQDKRGHILAVEVKASASVGISDFAHLKAFQMDVPDQFLGGIVVYKGDKFLPFGHKMFAIPVTWLF